MLFGNDEDLELQPKRTKTLLISLGIHFALIVFLVFNPDLLTSPPKRIIKVLGQDYDLSKEELTELVVPPQALRPSRWCRRSRSFNPRRQNPSRNLSHSPSSKRNRHRRRRLHRLRLHRRPHSRNRRLRRR